MPRPPRKAPEELKDTGPHTPSADAPMFYDYPMHTVYVDSDDGTITGEYRFTSAVEFAYTSNSSYTHAHDELLKFLRRVAEESPTFKTGWRMPLPEPPKEGE